MTAEEWRPIAGYPHYFATSSGRIVSCQPRWKQPRELKGGWTQSGGGYRMVLLVNADGVACKTIHGLVATAFHGPRPEGMQARHLDGDKTNNAADNLRWGTASENNLDKVAHGTHPNARKTRCKRDHPFDEANTYWHGGKRSCRTCTRDQNRERVARQRAVANISSAAA